MPYNSRVPGHDDQPDDAVDPAIAVGDEPGTSTSDGQSHRGEPIGLRARLVAARYKIAGVTLVLLLGGAALAAGIGPGDGLGGGPEAAPPVRSTPDTLETPAASEEPDPVNPGSTVGLSYVGLCRAFQLAATTDDDAAADPAFSALADDANGQTKVEKYCSDLLGEASADATDAPTSTSQPTVSPTRPGGSTSSPRPTVTVNPTQQPTPTATAPGSPTPSPTTTRPGGKPTKTPRP